MKLEPAIDLILDPGLPGISYKEVVHRVTGLRQRTGQLSGSNAEAACPRVEIGAFETEKDEHRVVDIGCWHQAGTGRRAPVLACSIDSMGRSQQEGSRPCERATLSPQTTQQR
jgi:hypothetical protein